MIRVRDLRLTYRGARTEHRAIQGISLELAEGAFYTLLGPSGCGKTAMLRAIAGLDRPDAGEIVIGNELVYSSPQGRFVPPQRRNIGMVFPSSAIWPHMSVFENVAFPLRNRSPRLPSNEIRQQVMRALALVRLDEMRVDAMPDLSGDERHRVALARALVTEPGVLLLDEPFDGLDAKGREDMRLELRELVDRLKVTTLLVTHDRIEALTMSDRIGVMCDGALVQEGPPAEVYRKPADVFVANYLGRSNILTGRVVAPDRIKTEIGTLHCPVDWSLGEGDAVTLAVRPENIRLATGIPSDAPNVISGQVEKVVYFGNLLECMVAIGDTLLRVQMHPSDAPLRGARVYLYLPVEHCLAMLG